MSPFVSKMFMKTILIPYKMWTLIDSAFQKTKQNNCTSVSSTFYEIYIIAIIYQYIPEFTELYYNSSSPVYNYK